MAQEKNYFVVTGAGLNLLANLQAGTTLNITRVVVGDGEIPDGVDPRTLLDLVDPIAQATSTLPIVTDNRLNFDVEYRNDLGKFDDPPYWIKDGFFDTTTGKLVTGFALKEYGVFALNAIGDEILLYYATIAAYPEPVYPYTVGNIQIKRYPVQIELMNAGIGVALEYDAGAFVTHQQLGRLESDVEYLLNSQESGLADHIANTDVHVTPEWKQNIGQAIGSLVTHTEDTDIHVTAALQALWNAASSNALAAFALAQSNLGLINGIDGRVSQIEDSLFNGITANPFTISFSSLSGLLITYGIWNNTLQRVEC
ncbi:hypothetical protein FACS1894208_07210 [Clostridia bacterium]|nr:hypothetical protein FACS1894208_07210 [Clostridia bacterium]